jgi:hypothetical protein
VIAARAGLALYVVATLVASVGASAAQPTTPDISDIVLRNYQRDMVNLQTLVRQHRLTAVVFFSSTCPCFAAHRARLDELVHEMEPRDVRFLFVDSERHARGETVSKFVAETRLPILRDDNGRLARRLDAQFATETFVFDATGTVRYRGGIDDDRKYLHQDPRTHLRDALLSLLSGAAPRYAGAKALGCALRLM